MKVEINGRYGQYQTDYAERLKAEQKKTEETEKEQKEEKAPDKIPVPHDEYISSEKSSVKPGGLYRLGKDEEGRKKIFQEKPAEKCTGNTDQVDREIEKLKEKKQQLEQQIRSAAGNENEVRELKKKLAQVESELSRKDNDTYRRQHTAFSE